MKVKQPTPAMEAFMADLKGALAKHQHLSSVELLAITSQFLGNLIALQDQTAHTAEQVMEMVHANIIVGNRAVVDGLTETRGSA